MKHATTRILFAYWDSLRGSRAAPDRADVQPGGMRHVLADAFILSNEEGATFRLAGSRIGALFSRDLGGSSFRNLWHPDDLAEIDQLLGLVVEDTIGIVLGVLGTNVNGSEIAMEAIVLPLRHLGRTDTRMLGALSPSTLPSWAGLVPLAELRVRSVRIIDPTYREHHDVGIAALGDARHSFVVHDGGAP